MKYSIGDYIYKGLKFASQEWDKTRIFTKKYKFIDRRKNANNLVMILAGYQQYVWDIVFARIKENIGEDFDICVVSSGIYVEELANICEKNGWSYLSTKANKLSIALNTAIKIHPMANYIFKLDEDIFVGKNFFKGLLDTHLLAENEGIYRVGLVAPIMNINGASYRYFLREIDKIDEYESLFGKARITCNDDNVFRSGEAGKYLWEIALPLDNTVELFNKKDLGYKPCPVRYSIGAILFKRAFWDEFGGFKSAGNGDLAWDEISLCSYCMVKSGTILIADNVFAGHFGFGCQKEMIIPLFKERIEQF